MHIAWQFHCAKVYTQLNIDFVCHSFLKIYILLLGYYVIHVSRTVDPTPS